MRNLEINNFQVKVHSLFRNIVQLIYAHMKRSKCNKILKSFFHVKHFPFKYLMHQIIVNVDITITSKDFFSNQFSYSQNNLQFICS